MEDCGTPSWDCVGNMVERISDTVDTIEGGWDEMIDEVVNAMESEDSNPSQKELLINLYQYLCRVWYRLKANPTKRPFNIISEVTEFDKQFFRITNYDYKMFKWAKAHKFNNRVCNDSIDIPQDALDNNTKQAFKARIK